MSTSAPTHLTLGRKGEALAARYLASAGLSILARNWRCSEGELDLVAYDGRRVIVCEVKTRTGTHFGNPGEAVTDEKAYRIRRLARRWLRAHGLRSCELRFGIVSVLWPPGQTPKVCYIPEAF